MFDKHGRKIDYIRISVTDRCNMRCVYCMPEEGIIPAAHADILSYEEILRICKVLAELGVKKVKLTGGEPLVRKDLCELITGLHKIPGIENVTLTTNGYFLKEQMGELVQAGINGVNISLDTLNSRLFAELTRRDLFPGVWEGIQTALGYAEIPLKINCVPLGIPEQDIVEVAALAKKYPIHVRFIEMMPIGYGKQYTFRGQDDVMKELEQAYGPMIPAEGRCGNGPGRYYTLEDFQGKIGFISSISHKFCSECNRIRLTAQGFLKTCLQFDAGCDLREPLRIGADDRALRELIEKTVAEKPLEHQFFTEHIKKEETHSMAQIGG